MARPESIKTIKKAGRTRDEMLGLYALWQRDFPDGIGVTNSKIIKDDIIGNAYLWKCGYNDFFEILIEIEDTYIEMEKVK